MDDKPTRTPERIETAGKEAMAQAIRAGTNPHLAYAIATASESQAICHEIYQNALNAALQSPAPELGITAKADLMSYAPEIALHDAITRKQDAQSPAGEWRDISTAEKESGKEIIGAIFKGTQMLREPFTSFWSPTLNRFYANPTHYIPYPLPPAPTRSQDRSSCSGER